MRKPTLRWVFVWWAGVHLVVALTLSVLSPQFAFGQLHELVLRGGRVIDPESRLDAVRHVAFDRGRITAVSETPLEGKRVIDASGLIVAPGFIDLHQHAWDEASLRLKALDGVTSVLELEVGTANVAAWYAERAGRLPLNHGVSVGHIPVRMEVMGDPPQFLPSSTGAAATKEANAKEIEQMSVRLTRGLADGAVAVGFGLAYTPAASEAEIEAMFRVAADHRAACHMHLRSTGFGGTATAAIDAARLAAKAKAPLHIVHLSATAKVATPDLLRLVDEWQAAGQDVTGEVYPWTAGMTDIQSAIFDEGWQGRLGVDYDDLFWGETGARLDAASFLEYRRKGGLVILINNTEEMVTMAVKHPAMMIASDGLKGHPRNAGTYARTLGHYVRDREELELMAAIEKMSLLPACRLEKRNPAMRRKGRVQVGCDADVVVLDLERINAMATYEQANLPSQGIVWLFVHGVPVIDQGRIVDEALPGQPIRVEPSP